MAQLRPRPPLLSAPTVIGVSDGCRKEKTTHTKSKRVITPARKEQNRIAQKMYRQRHKQNRAKKEQLFATKNVHANIKPWPVQPCPTKEAAASSGSNTSEITRRTSSIPNTANLDIQHDYSRPGLPEVDVGPIATSSSYQPAYASERFIVDNVQLLQAGGDLHDLGQSNPLLDVGALLDSSLVPDLNHTASLDMVDISAPRLTASDYLGMDLLHSSLSSNGLKPDLGSAFVPKSGTNRLITGNSGWLDESMSMPSLSTPEDQIAENKDLIAYSQAGVTALDDSQNHKDGAYLADPYRNAISFSQVTILNICVQNAKCLGMAPEDFISDNCLSLCSPFYRPASASDDPTALLTAVSRPYTPTFLRPTLSQILFPHHPIFDLIPIPAFRERAIMLATTSPALLNSLELKQDILCGGLVCWGTKYGSNHVGNGQPWDLRSWEAAPWFLKKWRLLVGGKDGDLWKQSMWWRSLRGEAMAF